MRWIGLLMLLLAIVIFPLIVLWLDIGGPELTEKAVWLGVFVLMAGDVELATPQVGMKV